MNLHKQFYILIFMDNCIVPTYIVHLTKMKSNVLQMMGTTDILYRHLYKNNVYEKYRNYVN